MNTNEQAREWVDVTDGSVANSIFGEYGFTPAAGNTDDDSPAHAEAGHSLMQRATAILPLARYARYVPKNPMLIGAAVLGVAGVLAWRNREKIRATAAPLLQNAADKTAELRERIPWTRSTGTPAGMQENLH